MTNQSPEVTRPRPLAELRGESNSEEEPSKLMRLKKFGGAAFTAGALAMGGMLAGETPTAPSEREATSHPIDIFGESSLQVVDVVFKDGRELTYGKEGNGTLRFPNGSEYTHHKDDPIKFGVSELQVKKPEFGKSKLRVVDMPHPAGFGESDLRVASSASSNAERKEN